MALKSKSLFLYGFEITATSGFIDFQIAPGGPILTAIIPIGYYSLTSFMAAIVTALTAIDSTATYTVTVDRTIGGGLQNRLTISSTGSYFSLLFGSGPHHTSNPSALLGFNNADYTGALTYTGNSTAGTILVPLYQGYNWVAPGRNKKVFGAVNVSTDGTKEAIVYQLQRFFEVEFKNEYETVIDTYWIPLMEWMIQQRALEFTPEISSPNTFYECTLETTEEGGDGLAFTMKEQLPDMPGIFRTGKLKFRQIVAVGQFI
jgi:hypothetical protein